MSGFEINGELYEVPRLDSLNLNEEQILYDVSGIVQADFAPAHPEASDEEKLAIATQTAEKILNPKFKRALVYIAYRRKHPDVDLDQVGLTLAESVNAVDSQVALWRGDVDDPTKGSVSEPESKKSSSGLSSSSDSSTSSESSVANSVGTLAPIGTTK